MKTIYEIEVSEYGTLRVRISENGHATFDFSQCELTPEETEIELDSAERLELRKALDA